MNKIDIAVSVVSNFTLSGLISFGDLHDTSQDGFLLDRIELLMDSVNSDGASKVIAFGLYPSLVPSSESSLPSISNGAFVFLETQVGSGNYPSSTIVEDLFTPLMLVNGACYFAIRGDTAVVGVLRLYGVYMKPTLDYLALSAFGVPLFPEIKP
jgi:hypothetical protein